MTRGTGRPTGVVFDLDGTLVDTVNTRIVSWIEAFSRYGIPATRDQLAPLIGIDGRQLAAAVANAAHISLDYAQRSEIDRTSGKIFDGLNLAPAPLPGFRQSLDAIRLLRIKWAIATSSHPEQIEASVRALGLGERPIIVDATQVPRAKPDPDLLLRAALRIGVDPERCWCVGDAAWDMIAAVAAGMIPVAVTAGSAVDATALRDAGACIVVGSLHELAGLIVDPPLDTPHR